MTRNNRFQRFATVASICVLLSVTSETFAQIPLGGDTGRPSPSPTSTPLTPEILGMPRSQISMGDRMIRLFNGRGAVSIRDKSLTGLQFLKFPPIDLRDWRFSLAFK